MLDSLVFDSAGAGLLLHGDNEALARALINALAWAAPDMVSLRTERDVLGAIADVLRWQGVQVLVLQRQPEGFTGSHVRLDAHRVAELEARFGDPIRLPAALADRLVEQASSGAPLLEHGWDRVDVGLRAALSSVLAGIEVRGELQALLVTEGPRFTPSAAGAIGQFARLAGSALENIGQQERLRERLFELRQAQRSMLAEERLSVLGEAAAVLAHEIRNPLAIVNNALTLMRRTPDSPQLLDIVGEEVARLDALTHDLLQLARPLEPRRQLFDLGRLIRSTVERMRSSRADLRIAVEHPRSIEIAADPGLLQLALENLLRNASQVSPEEGEIRVTVSTLADETLVAVDDQGPGVAPADRKRIFEPFFTTRASGTGLGLPIVKRIVQAHGGELRVGDSPFGGARFEMILANHPDHGVHAS